MRAGGRAGRAVLVAGTALAAALALPQAAAAQVVLDEMVDEPVPPPLDTDALNRQAAIDLAAANTSTFILNTPACSIFQFRAEGLRVVNTLGNAFAFGSHPCDASGGVLATTTTLTGEHRQFETTIIRTIDNRLGQPGEVEVRGLAMGQAPLRITANSLAQARTGLLTDARAATGRRYFAGTSIQTGGGPEVVTDRVISERVTRRQLVVLGFVETVGPGSITFGQLDQCPTATSLTGCVGGATFDVPAGFTNTSIEQIRILTITQQVERTITGGTTFFDVPLTALPTGAIHAAAAQGGFGASGRFLRRLTDGPGEGAARRGAFWGEAYARDGSFDASAALGRVEGQGEGLVLGLLLSPAEHITFGIAGEYGTGALAIPDPLTPESADLRQLLVGVHGRAAFGAVEVSLAASYGGLRVRSSGVSEAGAAQAEYDGDLFGVSGEAGYRLAFGPLSLRPHIGAAHLRWDRAAFSENGGPAPLAVAQDNLGQTRLWAGADAALALGGEDSGLTLSAYGRAVRASGDRQSVVTTFDPQLPGIGFAVAGPATARTSAELGAALDWRVATRVTLALGYDGRIADNQRDHAARAAVRVAF